MANPNFPNNPGYNLYVGARYIPMFSKHNDGVWDINHAYEPLEIVLYGGNSYTSKTFIPAGIELTNKTYWALTGNYNAQYEQLNQNYVSLVEDFNELKSYFSYVTPQMYGAKGDGVNDDTNAINLAIADVNNGVNVLFFPAGNYLISTTLNTINNNGCVIRGAGNGDSTIIMNGTTGYMLSVTGSNTIIENLTFTNKVTPTAGGAITAYTTFGLKVRNCYCSNVFNFVKLGRNDAGGSIWTVIEQIIGSCLGAFIDVYGGYNGIHVLDCQINSEFVNTNSCAMKFPTTESLDTVYMDNCLFQRMGHGLILEPTTQNVVIQNLFITNTVFDAMVNESVLIRLGQNATATRLHFNGCWFTSRDGNAITVDLTNNGVLSGVLFDGCDFNTIAKHAYYQIGVNSAKVSISDCNISAYNKNNSALYAGIKMPDGAVLFSITNNTIGNIPGSANTCQTAVEVGDNCAYYIVSGNIVYNNTGEKIKHGTNNMNGKIIDNVGYRAQVDSIPAVPASGVRYTHNFPYPATYYVYSGNVSMINLNGGRVPTTGASFVMNPGDWVEITYTGTLAWYVNFD